MTGPGHFELGMEARAHQRIERLVLDLHAVRPPHPLAQRLIGGKAFRTVEGVLNIVEDLRGEQDGFTRGDVGRQRASRPPVA